jgi:hypothetical protein
LRRAGGIELGKLPLWGGMGLEREDASISFVKEETRKLELLYGRKVMRAFVSIKT